MKLKIGENIKCFRKARDITQEQLAEMLGVSTQSVSRWELGVCYPDIELLPLIAEFFGVSVDKLIGVDDVMEKNNVDAYLDRFQAAINVGNIDECISIAREGVEEYPNNYVLLNKLMYALFVSGDDDGNIPDWKENMEKNDKEIVELGERIIKYCPDQDIRLDATARLAFQHCLMGRKTIGRAVYETLPSQELCRENSIWWALDEDEKLPFLRKKIKLDYHSLRSYMWSLASSNLLGDENTLKVFAKVFELENMMFDGNKPKNTWGEARLNCEIASIYAKIGKFYKAYEHLSLAVQAAKDFDNRPETESFDSLLLGEMINNRSDFETSDTRSLCEIMRDKWLLDDDFDVIRNENEFREIVQILSE